MNLERLNISNNIENYLSDETKKKFQIKIKQDIYNRFRDNLKSLKNLRKLKNLDISNTDVDSGLEYLPESVGSFFCSTDKRLDAKCQAIYNLFADKWGKVEANEHGHIINFPQKLRDYKQWRKLNFSEEEIKEWIKAGATLNDYNLLQKWEEQNFTLQETKQWIKAGAKADEYKFVVWLRDTKKVELEWVTNHQEEYQLLKKRYQKFGSCSKCQQLNIHHNWCRVCNSSGKSEIDDFIQEHQSKDNKEKQILKWIPYKQFTKIEHIADGGFGKVYKAKLWEKNVALKSLHDSQYMTTEEVKNFLQEINYHWLLHDATRIVKCHGISRDSSNNYLIVMDYIRDGDLRKFLQKHYRKLTFAEKLIQLWRIADGLKSIHKQGLIHRDFHSGNILNRKDKGKKNDNDVKCYITDLGLCRPANEANKENKVFGVLPCVAPEVLRDKQYTQASDIYSFGIMAYELFSGSCPYPEYGYDSLLALRICEGLRPDLDSVKVPQLLKDLIRRCWDADPTKRPTAGELTKTLSDWKKKISEKDYKRSSRNTKSRSTEFAQQYQAIEKEYNQISQNTKHKTHPTEMLTSRLLNFKNLPQPRNSKEINEQFYTAAQSLSLDLISSTILSNTEQDLANRTKRQLSLESQTKINQGATKQQITEQTYQSEPIEIETQHNWTNLHPSFTPQLIQAWQNHNFTSEQTRDWINIHSPADQNQVIQEPEYYAWLRDIKQVDSDWVHNYGNSEQLKQEYQTYQQQSQQTAQIQQNYPPKQ